MIRALKLTLAGLGVLVLCMPAAFLLTFLLSPLWSWIEAKYGIESIGHSGPSDWCFYVVYGLVAGLALSVVALVRRHLRAGSAKAI